MPMKPLAGAHVRQPTRRALAKLATREKILVSARDLFAEKGYERATIRDIAAAAGMSTGAVFASFSDKSELFQEILSTRIETLMETMAAGGSEGDIDTALLNAFVQGYELSAADLPLLQAAVSVAWTPEQGQDLQRRGVRQKLVGVITEVIERAVADGQLIKTTPSEMLAGMMWDLFLAGFRVSAFATLPLDAMRQRTRDHINVVLAGFRAK
jgi:AcrR family transcriptional regulator